MTGLPYPIRLAGYGLRAPKTAVLGADVAGVVEAVGNDVTRFQPGDEVFGIGKGSYVAVRDAREGAGGTDSSGERERARRGQARLTRLGMLVGLAATHGSNTISAPPVTA
jgi:NADPH:quinone reductase-like Zn-dependent oxidoreductase